MLFGQPPVDCNVLPTFGIKELKPHLITGAIGLASLGGAIYYKNNSEKNYEKYVDDVFEMGLPSDAPGNNYDDANRQNKIKELLNVTGIAILSADVLILTYRYLTYKKQKRNYDRYCRSKNSVGFKPNIGFQSDGAFVGAAFTVRF